MNRLRYGSFWGLVLSFVIFFGSIPCYAAEAAAAKPGAAMIYEMGDTQVIAICDSVGELSKDLLIGNKERIDQLMPEEKIVITVNSYVIKREKSITLIDTGFGGDDGKMLDGLKQAGITPGMVDTILLTHLHGDHVNGLLKEGNIVFPKAEIYVAASELAYWFNDEEMNKVADKTFFNFARNNILPYRDRVKSFEPNAEIVPGITAVHTAGHTPGHAGYLVQAKDKKMFIWGDLTHFTDLQLAAPEIAILFDVDPTQAIASRKAVLTWVADEQIPIAGMHIVFPGIGMIHAKDDKSYVFEAINMLGDE